MSAASSLFASWLQSPHDVCPQLGETMRIVVSKGHTKREIYGPFELCASLEHFRMLRDEINRVIDGDVPFTYGWIQIIPDRPKAIANTPPEPWE